MSNEFHNQLEKELPDKRRSIQTVGQGLMSSLSLTIAAAVAVAC